MKTITRTVGAIAALSTFSVAAGPGDRAPTPPLVIGSSAATIIESAVTSTDDGSAMLVWIEQNNASGVRSLRGRRVNAAGVATAAVFDIETPLPASAGHVRVAMDATRRAMVVWEQAGADGDGYGIRARSYDANGSAIGAAFVVNQSTIGDQRSPSLATSTSGHLVAVIWDSPALEGGHAAIVRPLTIAGGMFCAGCNEFRVNGDAATNNSTPVVAIDSMNDRLHAFWVGPNRFGGTGDVVTGQSYFPGGNISGYAEAFGSRYGSTAATSPAAMSHSFGVPLVAFERGGQIYYAMSQGIEFQVSNGSGVYARPRAAASSRDYSAVSFETVGATPVTWVAENLNAGGWTSRAVTTTYPVAARNAGVGIDVDGNVLVAMVTPFVSPTGGNYSSLQVARFRGKEPIPVEFSITPTTSVFVGQQLEYTFNVRNAHYAWGAPGIGELKGLALGLTLPSSVSLSSVTGADWNCVDYGSQLYCAYAASLMPQASTALTIRTSARQFPGDAWLQAQLLSFVNEAPEWPPISARIDVRMADMYPDAFQFDSISSVPRNTWVMSNAVQILGVESDVPVSVSGGEYSVNGGPWTAQAGVIHNGDQLRLRLFSMPGFSMTSAATVHVGHASPHQFVVTTEARDTAPDAFAFIDVSGVARSAMQPSNAITVSGINDSAAISVSNGEFRVNDTPFSSAPRSVLAGDVVEVRHVSAAGFLAETNTTLSIGGVSDTFTSITEASDSVPDAFAFADVTGVLRGTLQTSSTITVAGVNDSAAISVSNGEYRVNGAAFTSAASFVVAGNVIEVRHVSAPGFLASTNTTLSIGGVSDTFTSTTEAMDSVADAFSLVDQTALTTNTVVTSAAITVTGVNVAVPVSIVGGSYSINGGAFTSASGTVNAGDQLRVRVTTASTATTAVSAVLTVGGVSDTFSATTGSIDSTPNAFVFTDVTGAKRNKAVISNTVTVSGINTPVAISVSGGGAVKYSKNGAAFTAAAGTVVNGDQVRLQLTASSSANTRIDATATIAGISDTWSVTTQ